MNNTNMLTLKLLTVDNIPLIRIEPVSNESNIRFSQALPVVGLEHALIVLDGYVVSVGTE